MYTIKSTKIFDFQRQALGLSSERPQPGPQQLINLYDYDHFLAMILLTIGPVAKKQARLAFAHEGLKRYCPRGPLLNKVESSIKGIELRRNWFQVRGVDS